MNQEFKTTIGLEIHVELKTKSKMFCNCQNPANLSNNIAEREPNSFCCPICMGFPGTLPVANKTAIDWTILTGLALNCKIQKLAKFDRKHYFYPDLPKGFQISQYDMPFCRNGFLEINGKTIRINRVHLEEDAGKLIHPINKNYSLVDLNRAGTPLMEVVTEPDINSPEEARNFMQKLRQILRHLGVSDADMEKGHLRCDANIDVSTSDNKSPIVEIKNLNSFKFVEKALSYEIERLKSDFDNWPENKTKETRGFNSKTGETYQQRTKEETADYRYFPEPDLPVFEINAQKTNELKKQLPEMPEIVKNRYQDFGFSDKQAELLVHNQKLGNYFDKVLEKVSDPKLVYSWICVELLSFANKEKKEIDKVLEFEKLIELLQLIKSGEIPNHLAKRILPEMIKKNKSAKEITNQQGLSEISVNIEKIIKEVISKNPQAVSDYKKGKENAIGFLVGQIMKETKGQVDPQEVNKQIKNQLKN